MNNHTSDTAILQDKLIGDLIGLARSTENNEFLITASTDEILLRGLFATITNANYDNNTLSALILQVDAEKRKLVPNCYECTSSCGRNNAYDMNRLWDANEDIRSLKLVLLSSIKGIAAYAYHAWKLGYTDKRITRFLYKSLFAIGMDNWGVNELLPIITEVAEINLLCYDLLKEDLEKLLN